MRRSLLPALAGLVGLGSFGILGSLEFLDAPVHAAGTRAWEASTPGIFAEGTLDGAALDEEGRVVIGPDDRTLWGPESGIVWDVDAEPDATWVGLSGPGRVLRVTDAGEVETWLELGEETLVTAIAAGTKASGGKKRVFAGRSPEGEILEVRGPGEIVSRGLTGSKFVWALVVDVKGAVWAGTGSPGKLLRSPDTGVMVDVLVTGDDPVRAIAPRPAGGVVIGTGGRGRVIRIDSQERPFVLFDADEKEIVAVVVTPDDTVYALAAGGAKNVRARPQAAPRTADNTVTVTAPAPPGESTEEGGEPEAARDEARRPAISGAAGGGVYRIDPDGTTRKIWTAVTEVPFGLALEAAGTLLVATGDEGRLIRLDPEGRATRLVRIGSEQASAVDIAEDGTIWVGASTDARLVRLDTGARERGSWTSAPIDAGTVAGWGRFSWDGAVPAGTGVTFELRAGNTDEPDETWSAWHGLESGKADMPAARFGQVRATLQAGPDTMPSVRSLRWYYAPRNRPPQMIELRVEPPGVAWTTGPVQTGNRVGPVAADDPISRRVADALQGNRRNGPGIRKSWEHGTRTFAWNAQDPDDDRLDFTVEVRREGDAAWFPLASLRDEGFYNWDARAAPDGSYRARVSASDGRDNPGGREYSHSAISEVFVVDNTRPAIEGFESRVAGSAIEVRFQAVDPGGQVAAVEIGLVDGVWEPLVPLDGVADSEREEYVTTVPRETTRIRIRVTDAVGNPGGDLRTLGE